MAWTESLPSGKYRGGYRLPTGEKRRVPGSFDTKRRALAEATKAEEAAARPGWKDPKAAARSWGDWNGDWWPTRDITPANDKNERSMLKKIDERWGNVPLADIDANAVKAWAVGLKKSGDLAPTSVNRHLAILRTSLSAAVEAGVLLQNPALGARVTEGEKERTHLTKDEAAALLEALTGEQDKRMVAFMLGTGVRFGEAAGLQVPRVARALDKVRIVETWLINQKELSEYPKGRKLRTIPLPAWAAEKLEPVLEERKAGFVFPGSRGPAVSHSAFLKRIKKAAVDAGILENITPHTTRHSYATWMLEGGVPMMRVSRLLGHESYGITDKIYSHVAPESGDNVTDALPDL